MRSVMAVVGVVASFAHGLVVVVVVPGVVVGVGVGVIRRLSLPVLLLAAPEATGAAAAAAV